MEITSNISSKSTRIIAFAATIFLICGNVQSQTETYNYYYRVYFRDKGDYNVNSFSALELLSEKAVARRQKAGITVPDLTDLPVFEGYINQIVSMGYKLHCTSRWMNTGLFKTGALADIDALLNLSFVKDVRIVKRPAGKSLFMNKLDFEEYQADIPPFDRPLSMLNGYALHNSGYDGTGITIAVLDGGFLKADLISSLDHVRRRNGIRGTYDFVSGNDFVYAYHYHGTAVLSVLAGIIPQVIEGTAPGADFWLLRTEDTFSEFPVEEDFWAAGAEFADSVGADVISSSLGYFNFDDPTMNYKFSDMDGNTTFITRAADLAASKGIVVVASAGNERNMTWQRIVAPSDGDSVIAAGAVDGYDVISTFSSAGPSADGRIKPDNVAQGVSVTVQTLESVVSRANGTSFSCPILSGMCACVMQAVPEALNTDIIRTLYTSADRYNSPDSLYGYGIPDMVEVVGKLQEILVTKPGNESIIGPNPFTGDLEIIFKQIPETLILEIFTASGAVVVKRNYQDFIGRTLKISDLQNMGQGIYIIRLITANGTFTHKVIKLNN
jgi:subtilisin family serine protease